MNKSTNQTTPQCPETNREKGERLVRNINGVLTKHSNLLEKPSPFKGIALRLKEFNLVKFLFSVAPSNSGDNDLPLHGTHPSISAEHSNHGIRVTGTNRWNVRDRNTETMECFTEKRNQEFEFP